jgi:hypothetical protein
MTPARHRKRCQRDNIVGHAHYLTFSCYRRQRFLARERSCRWMLAGLEALERHDVAFGRGCSFPSMCLCW